MTDIVERLRGPVPGLGFEDHDPTYDDRMAAAAEIERLRAALRHIRGWREIGRDDRLKVIEEICEEALGDVCIGCGAGNAPHQTVDGSMCSTCLANTGGTW